MKPKKKKLQKLYFPLKRFNFLEVSLTPDRVLIVNDLAFLVVTLKTGCYALTICSTAAIML